MKPNPRSTLLILILLTTCTKDRPWTIIEARTKGSSCEYVLSRSNGFGPQVKTITAPCGKYKLFQTIEPWANQKSKPR